MPQGFKNSPAIFQMIMDNILNEQCCVCLDDIIVFGANEQEHDDHLNNVLTRLDKNNFKINLSKI